MKKLSNRTIGDIVLVAALMVALIGLAVMNAHSYNGKNKGLYIGNSETCTVGFEYAGTVGFFGDVSGCNPFGVIHASASVDTGRPDACRTYNVQFTFQGVENEDHKPCGPADYNKPAKEDKPADTVVPVVPTTPDVPVITEDKPADNDTPVQDEDTPADNTGNPGNDKPVGKSGEKCDKSMCENADGNTGEHGKSKND